MWLTLKILDLLVPVQPSVLRLDAMLSAGLRTLRQMHFLTRGSANCQSSSSSLVAVTISSRYGGTYGLVVTSHRQALVYNVTGMCNLSHFSFTLSV